MQSQLIKNSQINASSYHTSISKYEPFKSRLNHSSGWRAYPNTDQWLQIDLLGVKKITGIATQGNGRHTNSWVKEFHLEYLNSTGLFTVKKKNGIENYKGNKDHKSIVFNAINPPIIASVVRIKPIKWNGYLISMRLEMYGCSNSSKAEPCADPLGMQSGLINNSQITASSYYTWQYKHVPWEGRLDGVGGWIAEYPPAPGTWLQIDFLKLMKVKGISTQGHSNWKIWVDRYIVQYSNSTTAFTDYNQGNITKIFKGNSNNYINIVYNEISPPIIARIVRVVPTNKWEMKWVAMRIEMYGCHFLEN